MNLKSIKFKLDGGKPVKVDGNQLMGIVTDHLISTKWAGGTQISFSALMPDVFVCATTGENIDVTVGEALDAIGHWREQL